MTNFFDAVLGWFSHPFDSSGSALNWFGFVGLFLIIVLLWQIILLDLQREL